MLIPAKSSAGIYLQFMATVLIMVIVLVCFFQAKERNTVPDCVYRWTAHSATRLQTLPDTLWCIATVVWTLL